jgi:hypothetical protein
MDVAKIRKFENLHIAMWLVKDTCWVMDLHVAGMIMIAPTLSLAFFITWMFRKSVSETVHNSAVCLWIMANSIWMTGEFFYEDTLRPFATCFFIAGLMVIACYYLFLRKKEVAEVVAEAKRL